MKTQVWPVIHIHDKYRTLANAYIAVRCGCPGVLLIAMDGDDSPIARYSHALHKEFPDLLVGANFLSLEADEAIIENTMCENKATWCDGGEWKDRHFMKPEDHTLFAACAFKGETYRDDPSLVAMMAVARGFIPTTSGAGTGASVDIDKVRQMRNAIGPDAPLALSGVNPSTAKELSRLATHFLVATSISKNFYEFDHAMLQDLMREIEQ